MPPTDPKHISSPRPVNRRTAVRPLLKAEPINPVVHERLAAKWARNKLGIPLAEQLRLTAPTHAHQPVGPWLITGVVASATAAVVLLLAWIQQSWLLAMSGTAPLVGGICLIAFVRRSSRQSGFNAHPTTPFFDKASIQAFDRALDALAPEATDPIAAQLTAIKQQISTIAQLSINVSVNEHFTTEDRMYLTELVRRYLPDSLQSYLMVPKDQRMTQVMEHGETADSLLTDQLTLLGNELNKRTLKLTKSSAEKLIEQQRFLASKSAH